MIYIASIVLLFGVSGFLLWIAKQDFETLTIKNRSVLILLGVYVLWAGLRVFATTPTDLLAAAILFGLGLVMWLLRAMGAGDVKLYFAVGLFVGLPYLMVYASFLIVSSFGFYLLLVVAKNLDWQGTVGARLKEFGTSGKAPYAVPIVLAAVPTILIRAITGF